MKLRTFRILFFLAPLTLLSATSLAQSTWYVDQAVAGPGSGSTGDPYASIQYAIDQAATLAGDTILVRPGNYDESVDFRGKDVVLESTMGAGVTRIRGGGSARGVAFQSGESSAAELRGFTITEGLGPVDGGGIYIAGSSPTISECFVLSNKAERGGGIFVRNGSPLIQRCSILNNEGNLGAGVYVGGGDVVIRFCSIVANIGVTGPSSSIDGKGLWSGDDAMLTLQSVEITDHQSSGGTERGSGAYFQSGTVGVRGCTIARNRLGSTGSNLGAGFCVEGGASVGIGSTRFERNVGADFGGGLFGQPDVIGSVFEFNSAVEGGGAFGGTFTFCEFEGNSATGDPILGGGGGACQATLRSCRLINNSGRLGGGAYFSSLDDCTIVGNVARSSSGGTSAGGGVSQCQVTDSRLRTNFAEGGTGGAASNSDLTDCEITLNRAGVRGGAAAFGTLIGCEVSGNRVEGDAALGGGGLWECAARDCSLDKNAALSDVAMTYGGGAARSLLERTTLFGNQADFGGASWQSEHEFCTASGNRAFTMGGGVSDATIGTGDRQVLVINSIVWGNVPDQIDDSAMTTAVDWSIVEGDWPGTGNSGNDPLFVGPRSGDFHLRFGSGAIDAADPTTMDGDGSRGDQGAVPYDGSYVAAPTNFCLESQGECSAKIDFTGGSTLSGMDDFKLGLVGVPAQATGLLVIGAGTTPVFTGPRCVSSVLAYIPVGPAGGGMGCTGSFDVLVDQALLGMIGPGGVGYAQFAFQDTTVPGGCCGHSDGLEFIVRP